MPTATITPALPCGAPIAEAAGPFADSFISFPSTSSEDVTGPVVPRKRSRSVA